MTTDQLIEHFGSQTKAAAAIGTTPQAVNQWVTAGKIPGVRQFHIELITKRKLKADKENQVSA